MPSKISHLAKNSRKVESLVDRVVDALKKIPKGKVTTYSELAKHLGTNGCRAVGTAVGRNPFAPKVPCHRVVRSDGSVGNYAHGAPMKWKLLKSEGIEIERGKIADFEKRLYRFK